VESPRPRLLEGCRTRPRLRLACLLFMALWLECMSLQWTESSIALLLYTSTCNWWQALVTSTFHQAVLFFDPDIVTDISNAPESHAEDWRRLFFFCGLRTWILRRKTSVMQGKPCVANKAAFEHKPTPVRPKTWSSTESGFSVACDNVSRVHRRAIDLAVDHSRQRTRKERDITASLRSQSSPRLH
jgi:hypothetical protein